MTPVDTLGEPVTVVDALGEPVVLINEDGTPAFLAYSAKTYLGGVEPYHYADFINNRMLYAGADVGTVAGGTGYSFTRASDGYYTNSDGTLTLFGSGALRRGDRGVLIEGARTNLLLRSQEFDNAAWLKGGSAAVTANTQIAPDGTLTADTVTVTTSSADNISQQWTVASVANQTFAGSIFLKAAPGQVGNKIRTSIIRGSGGSSATAVDHVLTADWKRYFVTHTFAADSAGPRFEIARAADTFATEYYVWGAQVE
jgi:hypothetical protein